MFKRLSIILLTAISLCMADGNSNATVISSPLFAYKPFPLEGLNDRYQDTLQGKFATAPSTIYFNGAYHQFYCSNGQESDNFITEYERLYSGKYVFSPADHIRYRSSKDGVHWSAPRVVMHVKNPAVERSACDPSVVYGDDGFWYMLYTGNEASLQSAIYLARSNYIQGPYFKYVEMWDDETKKYVGRWENEHEMAVGAKAKVMIGKSTPEGLYGIGQQTVVKGPEGGFWVWYRVGIDNNHKNDIRFTYVSDLTQLNPYSYYDVFFNDPEDGKRKSFSESPYSIGDVRLNVDAANAQGPYLEMWVLRGYLEDGIKTLISKYKSSDGVVWDFVKNENEKDSTYGYRFIHNMGVSGDMHGYVKNDGYLISFAAPYLNGRNDNEMPEYALNRDLAELDDQYGFRVACHLFYDRWNQCKTIISVWANDTTHECYKIYKNHSARLSNCKNNVLGGYWPMWQVYVGGEWDKDTISYDSTGFEFPKGATGDKIKYFTGDYDGDGISDLGAVDCSSSACLWYIYSSRKSCYINKEGKCKGNSFGEEFISEMNSNYRVVTGDFDGDHKTDIGAVDMETRRWYIYSSADQKKGIGYSSSKPNYIPWKWKWDEMGSGSKVIIGDYNGDGMDDRAICNGSRWYIISTATLNSNRSQGFYTVRGTTKIDYGWNWKNMGNKGVAVPGDFDGDGITDRAFYNGRWTSLSTRGGGESKVRWRWEWSCVNDPGTLDCNGQGGSTWIRHVDIENFANGNVVKHNMQPLAGDYDGDGVSDLVEVDTSSGEWRIYGSLNQETVFPDGHGSVWSKLRDAIKPVILVGDFDGDGKADRAFVDQATHKFYVISSKMQTGGVNTIVKSIPGKFVKSIPGKFGKSAAEKPIDEPKAAPKAPSMDVSVSGRKISVSNIEIGSDVTVFNVLGKRIFGVVADGNCVNFEVPSYGKYIVRSGAQSRVIMVK